MTKDILAPAAVLVLWSLLVLGFMAFMRFSGVKQFMEGVVLEGVEKGYVETLFGRRRYLPELRSPNQMLRRAGGARPAEREPVGG